MIKEDGQIAVANTVTLTKEEIEQLILAVIKEKITEINNKPISSTSTAVLLPQTLNSLEINSILIAILKKIKVDSDTALSQFVLTKQKEIEAWAEDEVYQFEVKRYKALKRKLPDFFMDIRRNKVTRDLVSKALLNHAKPILVNELAKKAYLSNERIAAQLAYELYRLTHLWLDGDPVKRKVLEDELMALIEKRMIDEMIVLKKNFDKIIVWLATESSLAKHAEGMATDFAQQVIDIYPNKTAQDLENYYQLTNNFIKNTAIRLQLNLKNATSRELHVIVKSDKEALENLANLIEAGTFDDKKQALQKKLNEFGLSYKDRKSYQQAVKSIEDICQQSGDIPAYITALENIEKSLGAIIEINDNDSTQLIVKAESPWHFFKVINIPEDEGDERYKEEPEALVSARKELINKILSPQVKDNSSTSLEHTHTVIKFNSTHTLLEATKVTTLSSFFKKARDVVFIQKTARDGSDLQVSIDSINGNTNPSFIQSNMNLDFARTKMQCALELMQGQIKEPIFLTLSSYHSNWKVNYALIKAHQALFSTRYRYPFAVFLQGNYSVVDVMQNKPLKSELKKLEDNFIEEYKTQVGSDEHANIFNLQANLCSPRLTPK
ncbi:hypothetical protein [Rickettsiella endosymbiont of Dermanyssus gallinae]|uniref:hypothetical protein n=1 Tax=Rickettsiella endosymbiont of Dermanyssus gallinae TaxID=2856608 RepID=UPI001C52F2F1|nr:hypothetical protein [Rickettsiella endosymbiont of Dermanyssus gallinae]